MSTNLSKIRTNRGDIGNEIWVKLPDLSSFEKTYLSGDEASGQTALSVLSGSNFTAGEFIMIGIPGTEQCEIRKIDSVTDTSITITVATSYSHGQGTLITFIPFDQIEIYSASSSGGSFSLLATVSIRADASETFYAATADANTVYYKARFKNSGDTTYSDYSDEVAATGFEYNSVWSVKNRALRQLGEKTGGSFTDSDLDDWLWEGRREFDKQFKRWSFRTSFDTDIGNCTEGAYSVSVPSTLRNPDTAQNILELRLGYNGEDVDYFDKKSFNEMYEGINHTTVATQPSVGATSIVLTDVRDFDSSGSIQIGGNVITYTAKDNSTGTLSGVPASGDGSIDTAHAVGVDAWQHASFGVPRQYTVYEDKIYFDVPFGSEMEGYNLFMDFYRTLPDKNSDADLLDEPDPDMFVSFLKYKIKSRLSKGKLKLEEDPDYIDYIARRSSAIKKEFIYQGVRFSPDIGHLGGE